MDKIGVMFHNKSHLEGFIPSKLPSKNKTETNTVPTKISFAPDIDHPFNTAMKKDLNLLRELPTLIKTQVCFIIKLIASDVNQNRPISPENYASQFFNLGLENFDSHSFTQNIIHYAKHKNKTSKWFIENRHTNSINNILAELKDPAKTWEVLPMPNGSEYHGQVQDGLPHGWGEYKFSLEDPSSYGICHEYSGHFSHGEKQGYGIMTYVWLHDSGVKDILEKKNICLWQHGNFQKFIGYYHDK